MSEAFLAEAQVRLGLVPGSAASLRAELIAAIAAATKGMDVKIPVTAVASASKRASQSIVAESTAATSALQAESIALQNLGKEELKKDAFTRQATLAESKYASALASSAAVQRAGVTATRETSRARAQYASAVSANARADIAWRAALLSADQAVIKQTASLLALTSAKERDALASLKQASAEAEAEAVRSTRASRLKGVGGGAGTSALSAVGLRGATLTASAPFIVGAASAIAVGASLKAFAEFEEQLNVFKVVARATDEQMKRVSATARELGNDITLPGVAANDAATAMTELARAGLDVQQSVAATRGVLELAVAAETDFATSARIVSNALGAFKLPGEQATAVADLLAKGANSAQGSILEMSQALGQAAGAASLAGVSFDDTVILLSQLAKSGLLGSDAGTSLRTSLVRLINPSKKAAEALRELKINVFDAKGDIRPEVFSELGSVLESLDPITRKQTIALIGGSDALRAITFLAQDGVGSFERFRDSVDAAAGAQETASARTQGLSGDLEALGNSASTLGTTLGGILAPVASTVAKIATGIIQSVDASITALGRIPEAVGKGAESVDRFAPGFRLAADAAADLGSKAKSALEDVGRLGNALNFLGDSDGPSKAGFEIDDLAGKLERAADRAERLGFVGFLGPGNTGGGAGKAPKEFGPGPALKNQIASVAAQASEGLDDNLAAAEKEFARISKVVNETGKTGNELGKLLLQQEQARLEVVRVQDQISANAAQAADDARTASQRRRAELERVFQAGIANREAELRLAADAAGNLGPKQDALILFLKKQTTNERLALADQIAARRDLKTAQDARTAALQQVLNDAKQAAANRRVLVDASLALQLTRAQNRTPDNFDDDKRIITLQIRRAQARIRELLRLKKKTQEEKLEIISTREEIEQLRKTRGELGKEAEKDSKSAKQGTSAFDLLVQASQTFAANAGNLINGNQPFAGPTGFTADLAQFLIRQKTATSGAATPGAAPVGTPGHVRSLDDFRVGIDRLIDALDRNTQATGRGNRTNGTAPGVTLGGLGYRPFRESGGVRAAVEASNV